MFHFYITRVASIVVTILGIGFVRTANAQTQSPGTTNFNGLSPTSLSNGIESSGRRWTDSSELEPNFRKQPLNGYAIPGQPNPYRFLNTRTPQRSISVDTVVDWDEDGHFHPQWTSETLLSSILKRPLPYTNPLYVWTYEGSAIGKHYGDHRFNPDTHLPLIDLWELGYTRKKLALDFGEGGGGPIEANKSPASTDVTQWPKTVSVTVKVSDPANPATPALVNKYTIRFHLPLENFVIVDINHDGVGNQDDYFETYTEEPALHTVSSYPVAAGENEKVTVRANSSFSFYYHGGGEIAHYIPISLIFVGGDIVVMELGTCLIEALEVNTAARVTAELGVGTTSHLLLNQTEHWLDERSNISSYESPQVVREYENNFEQWRSAVEDGNVEGYTENRRPTDYMKEDYGGTHTTPDNNPTGMQDTTSDDNLSWPLYQLRIWHRIDYRTHLFRADRYDVNGYVGPDTYETQDPDPNYRFGKLIPRYEIKTEP